MTPTPRKRRWMAWIAEEAAAMPQVQPWERGVRHLRPASRQSA